MSSISLPAQIGPRATFWRVALVILLLAICTGCWGSAEPELTYKPDFLPVELSIGKSGVSVEGDDQLVTPIGAFSIGARYNLPQAAADNIYVILRNRTTGYDHIFEVKTGGQQFNAVVDGTTASASPTARCSSTSPAAASGKSRSGESGTRSPKRAGGLRHLCGRDGVALGRGLQPVLV